MKAINSLVVWIVVIWTSTSMPPSVDASTASDCQPMDLTLVIPAGTDANSWNLIKQYVGNVLNQLNIGNFTSSQPGIRVAVVTYRDTARLNFDFKTYSTKQQILSAVAGMPQIVGYLSNIGQALQIVDESLIKLCSERPLATCVILAMYDIPTDDPWIVKTYESDFNLKGMQFLTVGLTQNADKYEDLTTLNSTYNRLYYNYSSLYQATDDTVDLICSQRPPFCDVIADIGFILDESTSISAASGGLLNWQNILQFVRSTAGAFAIAQSRTRVGVVHFATSAVSDFGFTAYGNSYDLQRAVSRLVLQTGETNMADGFDTANTQLFPFRRAGVRTVGVVITDGNPNIKVSDTLLRVNQTKSLGIDVIAVGITNAVNWNTLNIVASYGSFVIQVTDYQSIEHALLNFTNLLCQVIQKTAVTLTYGLTTTAATTTTTTRPILPTTTSTTTTLSTIPGSTVTTTTETTTTTTTTTAPTPTVKPTMTTTTISSPDSPTPTADTTPLADINVTSIRPLFGPVAGGTKLTIVGQQLLLSSQVIQNEERSGSIIGIAVGNSSAVVDELNSQRNKLFVKTLPSNRYGPEPIFLLLSNGQIFKTGFSFEYRPDPILDDIQPRNHLLVGGTELDVTGTNIDSVSDPSIFAIVVVTRFKDATPTRSQGNASYSPCTVVNGALMECRMPSIDLPADFNDYLQKSGHPIEGTNDTGALASYVLPTSPDRVDLYAGFVLDGVTRYNNISESMPNVKMSFYEPPTLFCDVQDTSFDPNDNAPIRINGSKLIKANRLVDVHVTVGTGNCTVVGLTDNEIVYRPPANKPDSGNENLCLENRLAVLVAIGNKNYRCGCMSYTSWTPNYPLIIGLTVGLGGVFIVALVVIVIVVKARQSKRAPNDDYMRTVTPQENINDYDLSPGQQVGNRDDYQQLQGLQPATPRDQQNTNDYQQLQGHQRGNTHDYEKLQGLQPANPRDQQNTNDYQQLQGHQRGNTHDYEKLQGLQPATLRVLNSGGHVNNNYTET